MTPEQVDLVRKSFDSMWPMGRDIADLCYGRFFELAPESNRQAGKRERTTACATPRRCSFSLSPFLRGEGRGEGLSPRARFVESPPHPNPPRASFARLGPASGERERTVVMAIPTDHIMLLADLIRRR